MPYRVTMELDAFNGTRDASESILMLGAMTDCLIRINEIFLASRPNVPLLYQSGVRYEEEPLGAEFWRDIPTVLKYGSGDCLPLDTHVLRDAGSVDPEYEPAVVLEAVPLAALRPGDRIVSEPGQLTTVIDAAATGLKPILAFALDNGAVLKVSPSHRMILNDNRECRADDLREGARLRTGAGAGGEQPVMVLAISEEPSEFCGDIKTESGRFLLADSAIVVHNCEDLAAWLVAEKRVRFGIPARPRIIPQLQPNGSFLYHIDVITPDVPGGIDDPSRRFGMR